MRVYNFSAGPAVLPLEVLEKAQKELVSYGNSGMSVMEMSHRSKDYEAIIGEAEAKLRKIMEIPENYTVLFLQGGASLQFAMIPLNLFRNSNKADYIESGMFASKALKEAKKFGDVNVVASSKADNYSRIPDFSKEQFTQDADYFYICANNTIFGTKFNTFPDTGDVPLVADMSSCILSEKIDVSKFGLIYAGAQKNLGPAGVTLVIIRNDLLGFAKENVPTMLDYKVMAENDSMYNTPPTYGIYMLKLVFEWIEEKGGVSGIEKMNRDKAAILYDFLDRSSLFKGTAAKEDRSLMNVTFVTGDNEIDAKFVKAATAAGFVNLKGHRSVGGMRASIYNAMPIEGVKALVAFMEKFESEN
ncbi:3-phosphoserine/phosphohydroxythreonine transaminase [Cellulosilyticum sp. I15G10I2]|uniref:3-phosphoserine/phosphohydroxythreonine transaminase n=1 Tax=Cellulosilyticum sp. I15G10I2 TaxID=1892843 RepID=UPI00085CC6C7|nr:3-phosphoserine/phosphohydroxythreonine transaminase [Cellulosilyticum sp. I15G10I2]